MGDAEIEHDLIVMDVIGSKVFCAGVGEVDTVEIDWSHMEQPLPAQGDSLALFLPLAWFRRFATYPADPNPFPRIHLFKRSTDG